MYMILIFDTYITIMFSSNANWGVVGPLKYTFHFRGRNFLNIIMEKVYYGIPKYTLGTLWFSKVQFYPIVMRIQFWSLELIGV